MSKAPPAVCLRQSTQASPEDIAEDILTLGKLAALDKHYRLQHVTRSSGPTELNRLKRGPDFNQGIGSIGTRPEERPRVELSVCPYCLGELPFANTLRNHQSFHIDQMLEALEHAFRKS